MKRIEVIFFSFLLFCLTQPTFAEQNVPYDIRFRVSVNNVPFPAKTNPYYLSHILEVRIFRHLNLDFSPSEIESMVDFMITHASKEHPNQIYLPGYEKDSELVIGFRYIEKEGDLLFLVVTNYNVEKNKIDTSDFQKQLATICQVKSNRFVYFEDLYSDKKATEYKEEGKLLSLANLYLMDEDPNNDDLVDPLLEKILTDEKSHPLEKFYAFLTRGQLALIQRNLPIAEEIKSKSQDQINQLKGDDKLRAEYVMKLFSKELETMKVFQKTNNQLFKI
ncbi:hypothetical protein EHQ92_11800 [Leptospira biflexa]|jgi:hypothetical protein|uniref:Uncharacterized protein n=1 Tax=Leptospira biflexa serovar Patoc (strain Patoc 1 / ATCC 23582 / Paris) TaxID=456481 RepID=B0SRL1_LEPBP|nr:hypothetical protein [Leptospira biflexa]ABZ94155.1 Hypothetical protein LBF_1648 [Leptospira biflexa serovar Patoc strain 'Patoc 1 (Ames)']ABZ97806.1 Hypothetical protein; putative signal peptide [Leptospira biflexa serovar Patoc strain 'Patoc 1 (Paris)']TGM38961.1 hypothetical protein EHQ89_07800 [Leptospira biflexa]TGM39887.1 hypothetical protein EHQ80_01425 [Leptospira biflexa]TGM48522.1 hypothetical protein EHQ92_11800 [Leptospira biflexa]